MDNFTAYPQFLEDDLPEDFNEIMEQNITAILEFSGFFEDDPNFTDYNPISAQTTDWIEVSRRLSEYSNTADTPSQTVVSIDRDTMAKTQLETLGYVTGEKVFLRFFYPKWHPKYEDAKGIKDKGIKSDFIYPAIPWEYIDRLQNDGRGCYFVVNGQNQSYQDKKTLEILITQGKSVFYEHDDLPRELQLDLWKTLELPEPTIQVDSGGKSIHSYWVFDKPIEIADWKTLQSDLLDFSEGDKSIKNPSRVMRLAGAIHIGENGNNQSVIVSNSGTRYSFDNLRSIVPSKNLLINLCDKTEAPSKPLLLATESVTKAVENSNSSIPSVHDIKTALSHLQPDCIYHDWLAIGMALHSQDDNLLTVWDDWSVGTKSRPSKKYEEGLCGEKWKTFTRSGDINIYKLFQIAKDHDKNYQAPKSIEVEIQKIQVANNSVKPYATRPTDLALEINELETEDLCNSVSSHQATINGAWDLVKSSVPHELVTAFEYNVKSTGVPEMASLVTILCSTSAAVNASYAVVVPRQDKPWLERLNFMVALVGEAGGLKSQTCEEAVKAFQNAQISYNQRFKEAEIEYKRALSNFKTQNKEGFDIPEPEAPIKRTCNFGIGTMESLVNSICDAAMIYNSGVLWNVDELDQAFGSLNKYNAGDDDIKLFLSFFNGGFVQKDLVKSSISSDRTPISLLGGIQENVWLVVSKKMSKSDKNNDGNGFTGRFLLGLIPKEAQRNIVFGDPNYSVNPVTNFIENFRNAHLDRPGMTEIHIEKTAISFCSDIETWAKKGIKSTGLKNHYSKGISYTYRLAGLFALWSKRTVINLDDLKAARAVVDYSIATDRVIHHNNDTSTAIGVVSKAYELAKKKGKLTTRILNDAKLGTVHDRQAIISKVSELYGGNLTKNNRGSLTWTP